VKISIIIPCYNYGHLVEKAIASAATNHPEVEVIVLNDGSTDDSLNVLHTLSKYYNFVLIDKPNAGLSDTRNQGINLARGEYLIFLDADDYLTTDAITLCLNAINNNPAQLILAEHYNIVGQKRSKSKPITLGSNHYNNVKRYITKDLSIVNGGCLMHKDIFATRRYNPALSNSEDIPIFIHALANFSVKSLNKPIVSIVKHSDSLRHDIAAILETGTSIVDDSFDNQYINDDILTLKPLALAHRYSSIGRACYRAKMYKKSRHYYFMAIKSRPYFIFKESLLKRFIISTLKSV